MVQYSTLAIIELKILGLLPHVQSSNCCKMVLKHLFYKEVSIVLLWMKEEEE